LLCNRHRTNQDFWLADDVEHWDKEMADMRTMIEYFAGIPQNQVKGVRAPFLLQGKYKQDGNS
jgi:hypothetical protein